MVKIKLNYEKYDFLSCGVTIEKYLEYFGYKNPKSVGEKEYFVETIGFLLPAVEIKENLKESKWRWQDFVILYKALYNRCVLEK